MDAFFLPVGSVHTSRLIVELFRWTKKVFTKTVMVVLEVTLGSKAGSAEVLVRKMQKLSKSTLQINREGKFLSFLSVNKNRKIPFE